LGTFKVQHPGVSSLILFPIFATGVVDTNGTSGKFTAYVVDTGGKFATGDIYTGGKFATGVSDIGGVP
jgi:hypothetical protein